MWDLNDLQIVFSPALLMTFSNFILIHPYHLLTGVTILLSLTVFLNMVAETMPATSDAVPLLGKICAFRIFRLNVLAVVCKRVRVSFYQC